MLLCFQRLRLKKKLEWPQKSTKERGYVSVVVSFNSLAGRCFYHSRHRCDFLFMRLLRLFAANSSAGFRVTGYKSPCLNSLGVFPDSSLKIREK